MAGAFLRYFKPGLFLSLLALLISVIGCNAVKSETATAPTATIAPVLKNVTVIQAEDLIRTNKGNPNFIILDVRTPTEYAGGHLVDAVNIDFNAANFKEDANRLDKAKTYLVYCRTGVRSAAASTILLEIGFRDIYNMTGGITEWQGAGFPVVN